MNEPVEAIVTRLRASKHTALLTNSLPPELRAVALVRVACDAGRSARGPLVEARQKLLRARGLAESSIVLRDATLELRRLLGSNRQPPEVALVDVANRIADETPSGVALVFEGLERADGATVGALERIIQRSGWMRLPMILVFGEEPTGAGKKLVDALLASSGEGAFLRMVSPSMAPPADGRDGLKHLPVPVLRVLRAGATIGSVFEAHLVAALLGGTPEGVLELVQEAADRGIPIDDRGDGSFRIRADLTRELVESTLPSLAALWHARLGELLGKAPPAPRSAEATADPPADPVRAARHLEATGASQKAVVENLVVGARQAAAHGDLARASLVAERALAAADALGDADERRLLRGRALLEMARARWLGVGVGTSFSLADASSAIEQARQSLPQGAPAALRADLAATAAGIAYDVGDLKDMERAVTELTEASTSLIESGDSLAAARLLNDQAALYLRMGDPLRATHLLTRSRDLFEGILRDDKANVAAMEELAHTDLLLARIPLHTTARPGREADAFAVAMDHAVAAERLYTGLGNRLELPRVWETMGRLELLRERPDRATARFGAALEAQTKMADVAGLARTTAGFSEALLADGHLDEAVALLAESVELNARRGSPIGLAFNRRALELLRSAVLSSPDRETRTAVEELADRVARAEEALPPALLPETI
jgi:tetratricopeptide (TPR) repeat protein